MFSGYVKDIESKPSPTPWGSKMPFANMLAEFSNSVHVSINDYFGVQLNLDLCIAMVTKKLVQLSG